jgi:hypothetical protein
VTFANTADGAVAATPLPTQGVADAGKRFAELAQLKLGAETEARAAGFGVNLSRAETENLERSRTLNRPQSATLEDLTATSVAPAPVATSKSVAVVPAEQKTAAETPRAALGVSPLGDARADFDSDTTVFYRQSDLGSLPQVALAIDALDKKAEAAPQVLSRFTIHRTAERCRAYGIGVRHPGTTNRSPASWFGCSRDERHPPPRNEGDLKAILPVKRRRNFPILGGIE